MIILREKKKDNIKKGKKKKKRWACPFLSYKVKYTDKLHSKLIK